jgi:hypothetical protein
LKKALKWRKVTPGYGTENANADCLSRIHVVQTNDVINSEYNDFLLAETASIINSKIIDVNGSIKDADANTNLFLPISNDMVITHPAIRQIIERYNLDLPKFNENDSSLVKTNLARTIIFNKLKETHIIPLTEQLIFNTFNVMKQICLANKINTCSTIILGGVTTMTSFKRTRSMIRFIFKGTDITNS